MGHYTNKDFFRQIHFPRFRVLGVNRMGMY